MFPLTVVDRHQNLQSFIVYNEAEKESCGIKKPLLCGPGNLLKKVPNVENPPVPNRPAAQGQSGTHNIDSADDPMRGMKIPFGGDQHNLVSRLFPLEEERNSGW